MEYKHLFFDLDHTLWDFETNAKETLHELCDDESDSMKKAFIIFNLFYERYSYHNDRLWDRYTKGFIKQEELRWKRMWLALLDFKIAMNLLARIWRNNFSSGCPSEKIFSLIQLKYLNI